MHVKRKEDSGRCPGRRPGESLLQPETPPALVLVLPGPGRRRLPIAANCSFRNSFQLKGRDVLEAEAGAGLPVLALLASDLSSAS